MLAKGRDDGLDIINFLTQSHSVLLLQPPSHMALIHSGHIIAFLVVRGPSPFSSGKAGWIQTLTGYGKEQSKYCVVLQFPFHYLCNHALFGN